MGKWLSYYHPSTVVFVDDQQAFLTAVKNRLPKQMLAMFFNEPQQALNTIMNKESQYLRLQPVQEIEEEVELDVPRNTEALFNIDLKSISDISSNAQRYNEISVVIVDRMMPDLDGINFCRELSNHPVKKIMLTASKDCSIATHAFNEGIIDFFLLKDSSDLIFQLNSAIKNLQQEYFFSLSNQSIGFALEKIAPIIKNPSYINFTQELMKELAVEEYYLLDRNGSMLFIKKDGSHVKLVISSEEMINHYANIAFDHEETAFGQALLNKKKLLHFPTELDNMRPVKEWGNFLLESKKIPESSDIFFSLIKSSAPPKYYSPSN